MNKMKNQANYLFDPFKHDIRKGVFDRIRKMCDESIEKDRFTTKKIAGKSVVKQFKN